ncbi:biotin--acetyl-CoA-carboxylase ligase [Enterococcus faecium]|nr:biotin--acetyl-CoA-carboxylase ligase [Enterococcus faecium]
MKYFYLHNQKEDGTKNDAHPLLFSLSFFRFCFMYQPLFLRKLFCSLLLPDRMDGKGA